MVEAYKRRRQDDEPRLRQWLEECLPTFRPWLTEHLGVEPDDTVEGLVPLWTATMRVIRPHDPNKPVTDEDFPIWARWPDLTVRRGPVDPFTYALAGALGGYFGDLLTAVVGPPVHWEVYYDRAGKMRDDGMIVVARPKPRYRGRPIRYTTPLNDTIVLIGRQLIDLSTLAPDAVIVNRDRPEALRDTFLMRVNRLNGIPDYGS